MARSPDSTIENDWCIPLREAYQRLRPKGTSVKGVPYNWLRQQANIDSGTTITSIMKGHEPKTISNLRRLALVLGLELVISFRPLREPLSARPTSMEEENLEFLS